jgi:HEAT repeat protein
MVEDSKNLNALLNSGNADDRKQAILFIIKNGDTSFFSKLTEIAGTDPDEETRYIARKGLNELKKLIDSKKPEKDFSNQAIETLLESDDPYARFAGLKKALEDKAKDWSELLKICLQKEQIPQLKASFVIAIGRFRNPADLAFIVSFLNDPDSRIRANAVESLALIGTEEAYYRIIAQMTDEDNRVKANVIRALKSYGGAALIELVKLMSQDQRIWVRESAVFAFSKIKSPHSLAALGQMAVFDRSDDIRSKAIAIIKKENEKGNPAAGVILNKIFKMTIAAEKDSQMLPQEELEEEKSEEILKWLKSFDTSQRYLALCKMNEDLKNRYERDILDVFESEKDPFLISMFLAYFKKYQVKNALGYCIRLLAHDADRVRANAIEALMVLDKDLNESSDFIRPLLDDSHPRVVANAIIALSQTYKIEAFSYIKRMIIQGKESFRLSALHVMENDKQALYVPLFELLFDDPSPKLRDKAYEILREFVTAHIAGSLKLLQKVEKRISLSKNRDQFFENSLDQMFSSFLQMIQSEDISADKRRAGNPERERKALLKVADKAMELQLVEEKIVVQIESLDKEINSLEKILVKVKTELPEKQSNLSEATVAMTELEQLKVELVSLYTRREALLCSSAFQIWSNRNILDADTLARLKVSFIELERSLADHVPEKEFSMLPQKDASISEIFDTTMRIYQKHVWEFSVETFFKFIVWILGLVLAGFIGGMFKLGGMFVLGLYVIMMLPYALYKSLELFIAWKINISFMLQEYIHGRDIQNEMLKEKRQQLHTKVLMVAIRKWIFLVGWGILAGILAGVVIAASEMFRVNLFLTSSIKLLGIIVFVVVFGLNYCKYQLIEPISIFSPRSDAFDLAEKFFEKAKGKIILLFIFATFIMTLVTGASTEVLQYLLLFILPKSISIKGVVLVGTISQICLFPIVYSNMAIFTLMSLKEKK